MEKAFPLISLRNIPYYYFCVLLFTFNVVLASDQTWQCQNCYVDIDSEEPVSYGDLGDYEMMFRCFEQMMDQEETAEESNQPFQMKGNFIQKWSKKVKRWMTKKIAKSMKKWMGLKKVKNGDECAFAVAEFKRKIDKKFEIGSIDQIFNEFDRYVPKESNLDHLDKFKKRVKFYYNNKNAHPRKAVDPNRYNLCIHCQQYQHQQEANELNEIPVRALIGGIEIGCGCIMIYIPFPPVIWLGRTLIAHGIGQIYEGYMTEYEKNQQKELEEQEQCGAHGYKKLAYE